MSALASSDRPLGLKADFEVPRGVLPDVLATLEYIERFDLEGDPEFTRAAKRSQYGGATLEFKRFLALPIVYPGEHEYPFVPSLPLDALWHSFILNTPRYREFCDRVYGRYLDHVPGKSRHDTEVKTFNGPMQFTVAKVLGAFDKVNKKLWRKLAYCGPCSAARR